jgi:hypothetical protein
MSLYLPDQKLGAHSQPTSSSHKFMLKGRQTGNLHRGHSWVFRTESYDTMLAWYDDIKNLTEKTGEERNQFILGHSRSLSSRSAVSTSSFEDDEADRIPYSTEAAAALHRTPTNSTGGLYGEQTRPQPGGRFPSDVQVRTDLPTRLSGSSESSEVNHDLTTVAGGLQMEKAQKDGKLNTSYTQNTVQTTPLDQRGLKDLEGALYITRVQSPRRDLALNKDYTTERSEPKSLQQAFKPSNTEATRSQATPRIDSALKGASETTSPVSPFFDSPTDKTYPTPPATATSYDKETEADAFRYHASPERAIKHSTQEADVHAYHTATIETVTPVLDKRHSLPIAESAEANQDLNSVIVDPKEPIAEKDEKIPAPGITRSDTNGSISHLRMPGAW